MGCLWHIRVMKLRTVSMICLAVLGCGGAWAEDPPAAPSAADGPASTAAPAAGAQDASAVDSSTKPADQAAAKKAELLKEQDKRLRALGYRQAMRNGNLMYCRKEAVIGSRFTKVVCGEPDSLERAAENARQQTEKMQHQGLNQVQSN